MKKSTKAGVSEGGLRVWGGLVLGGWLVGVGVLWAESPLPDVARLQSSPVLRHLKPNPVEVASSGPGQTLSQMHVPEGFRVDLIAGEPNLHQPVAFAFDEKGRIWVAEAYSYPQKQPAGQGLDRLVILEDRDGNGTFETQKVFAEKLNLVSGFEVGHGGVWVGAAPELLFIPDGNHDDVPDGPPQVLLDGFGYQDTHECLNSFLWGPDGWLYGIQGVFNLAYIGKPGAVRSERRELRAGVWRYHPVRHEFEVFADGGSNPWGLDYDERGQLFMTHCRSYFGKGGTTHVVQGGQYWNQVNANYAPYIIADPPAEFPEFRNYLLASARYDHGAGGAGVVGSDAIYGGHSHVGTMIYLGNNWPEAYRGHLFTHNLHGHQINQQVNRRWGSTFDTVHAGRDVFFCSDPAYVAVDLQYGPDGAVYFIDWYDRQHCHNPNTERWDRTNGRLYRMQWQETYKPVRVDLSKATDGELVGYQGHRNAWYGRTARRLLQERAVLGKVAGSAVNRLEVTLKTALDPVQRLQALWALHLTGQLTTERMQQALGDGDEYVRAWCVQLACERGAGGERGGLDASLGSRILRMAREDASPVVRLYLASAAGRVSEALGWDLVRALGQHGEDREDRLIPKLLWHSLAQRMGGAEGVSRGLEVASTTVLPELADWIRWYACVLPGEGLETVTRWASSATVDVQRRALHGMALALQTRADVPMPSSWGEFSRKLYQSPDVRVVRLAEVIAAALGDTTRFPALRVALLDGKAPVEQRRHALEVLRKRKEEASVPVFLKLLDDETFRGAALAELGRYDALEIAKALVAHWDGWQAGDRATALGVLVSRPAFATVLLDAVSSGAIKRDQLTAFHIRQLSQLNDASILERMTRMWGRIKPSAAEKQGLIGKLEKSYLEAPLWAYSATSGKEHFKKLCAQCHRFGAEGQAFAPELTGAGRHGVRYFLENIIDPNAVVGLDFQMTTVETTAGESLAGLAVAETGTTLTLRTPAEQRVIPKSEIAQRKLSDQSLMPEGLLESLGAREQIELLKYLMGQ